MANGVSQTTVALSVVILILLFYIFFLYSRPRPIQTTIVVQPSSTTAPATSAGNTDDILKALPFNKPYVSTMTYHPADASQSPKPNAINELNAYYTPARRGIPTDFTMDSCSCPFAKPQSTDLPMPSMPTCLLLEKSSYKLSDF